MTDYALGTGDFVRPYRSPWGAFPTRSMKLSTGISSAVVRVGQLVVLDTSTNVADSIIPCATSSGSLNPGANTVVGFAAENSTANGSQSAAGTYVPVWESNPQVEFQARTRFGLLNSTIVNTTKELHRESTLNIDVVSLRTSCLATPQNMVVITGLIDASGDSGGRVSFKFIQSSGHLAFYR